MKYTYKEEGEGLDNLGDGAQWIRFPSGSASPTPQTPEKSWIEFCKPTTRV